MGDCHLLNLRGLENGNGGTLLPLLVLQSSWTPYSRVHVNISKLPIIHLPNLTCLKS